MDWPKATIGIPTYKRADRLPRCLQSVVAQDYPNLEIVISDNASPDATKDVCAGFARTDPRIRYMRQDSNIGSTANFNAVLAAATGEFFMWLSDDDWLAPNYVSTCMKAFRDDPRIALAAGQVEFPEEVEPRLKYPVPRNYQQSDRQARVLDYFWNVRDNSINCGFYRREQLAKVGMINTLAGDWLSVAQIATLGTMVTSTQTRVYRSVGGASRNHKTTVKVLGLPRWQQYAPKIAIAVNLSRYFYRQYPFDALDHAERRQLSIRIFLLLAAKKRILRWLLLFIPRQLHPTR